MSSKIIHNYKIIKSEFNLELKEFKDHKEEILKLLPDRVEYSVYFDLIGVSARVANAIRRTIIGELDVKALYFDPSIVDTTNKYSIRDELLNRVILIPINQDMPENSTFSLSVINTGSEPMDVFSADITGKESKHIPKKIRLAKLPPGTFLNIPEIKVRKDSYFNRDSVMYQLTGRINYDNLDFKDVDFVNYKCNRVSRRVNTQELIDLLKKNGINATVDSLFNKKILIIPSMEINDSLSKVDKEKIANAKYDHTIINKNSNDHENFLTEYSSSTAKSKAFRMGVHLKGNLDPKKLMPMVCDNLIDRLKTIKVKIDSILTEKSVINSGNQKTISQLTLIGETHTIAGMIVDTIETLVPSIPLIKSHMDHPNDKQITINVVHTETKKLILNSIESLIEIFSQIKDEVK